MTVRKLKWRKTQYFAETENIQYKRADVNKPFFVSHCNSREVVRRVR